MKTNGYALRDFISKNWRFAAGVLAAALVTLELSLHLLAAPTTPPVEMTFDHSNRNCARPVPGSVTQYRAHGLIDRGVPHRINNLGIRTDVPGLPADLTVAVLGGSAVYGVGVPAAMALPAALQSRFARNGAPAAVRFLNFGFPGFNLVEQVRELARLEPIFRPDAVIVMLDDESFRPALCARRAMPVRNLIDDNLVVARAAAELLLPMELFPGHALQMQATAQDVRVLASELGRIHDGPVLFVSVGTPARIRVESGNQASVGEVLRDIGREWLPATDADAPSNDVATGVANAIAPWVEKLVRAD